MTPFGWRFSGTMFGVLMLPVTYLFLKKLFGGCAVPALGTAVFAADFMHFVQTRIATIDTYGVFFLLLMYYFMYVWLSEDRGWALALSGVCFGLGAASKWTYHALQHPHARMGRGAAEAAARAEVHAARGQALLLRLRQDRIRDVRRRGPHRGRRGRPAVRPVRPVLL